MRNLGISLLCFLFICNITFLTSVRAEAANISKESNSYNYYIRGLLFENLEEYKQAKNAYQKAARSDFQAWDIHYRLALTYIRLGDFKMAERELISVLKIKPYDEKVSFLLALVYTYRSKFKAAISEYNKLLDKPLLELDVNDVRYSLAQLYSMQKDLYRAEAEYKIILENNPNDSNAHFYLGYIYSELSNIGSAIEEFKRSIDIDPANHLALNSLSYLYAELGENLDYALLLVQKALEFEPSNGAYLDTLGWIYFKKGDLDKAVRYLENASVILKDAEIFEHLGDVYLKMGMIDEARKNWKKSLAIEPQRKQVKEKIRESSKNK